MIQYRVDFLAPDGIYHFVLHILISHDRNTFQHALALGRQLLFQLRALFFKCMAGFTIAATEQRNSAVHAPKIFHNFRLGYGFLVIGANGIRDLGKIAYPVSGYDDGFGR
ncbi:MAG: hypothetical protein BWY09_02384 [Candidatus Hydrogenedentes bacterium ADurb.Bin179]|nr:MAG: hypothetical protein BWY09_02384 [Candidatus Hydrogenedentes bacterium ADurb.Bin179]